MNHSNDSRMQWHPACFAALKLEFLDNKEDLEFLQEIAVNDLPLRMDALIIKKTHNRKIKNEIGQMFRWYNLIEYKSPNDELSLNTFLKGIAEVYLYKVKQERTRVESYSLSFIRARKPVTLFAILERYGFIIEEEYPGIYYISGKNIIPIQIIVSSRLNKEEHIWLNSLSDKVNVQQAIQLIERAERLEHLDDKNYADSLWEVVETVNKKIIQKVREDESMACRALTEIMQPKIDEAFNSGFDNGFNNGSLDKGISIFKNMIKDGMSRELAQKYAEISDELVEKALTEI